MVLNTGKASSGVVAEPGPGEAAPAILILGTDQPCRTFSDLGKPSDVIPKIKGTAH